MICSITVKPVFLKSHNNESWSSFTVGEWPTFGIKLVAFLKILPHFDCVHTIYTNYSALAHNFNNTVRGWSWKSSFCCWTEFQNFHLSWPGGPWGSLCTSASCNHSRWRKALWPGKKRQSGGFVETGVSFYPAEDEEDEGEHEASVVAEGLVDSLLVGPSAVRSKHNHWALWGEVRDREPRRPAQWSEKCRFGVTALLTTAHQSQTRVAVPQVQILRS